MPGGRLEELEKLLVYRGVGRGRGIGGEPFSKIGIPGQAIGYNVGHSARCAAVKDAAALGIGKAIDAAKQHLIFRRQTRGE